MRGAANKLESRLLAAGIKPSAQRLAVAEYVLSTSDHPSADEVLERVQKRARMVSRATVYNTLHQFTDAGLLRQVIVDPTRTYFDTNLSVHHHFYHEGEGRLSDIPDGGISFDGLPASPEGTEIRSVDVIVRIG